jgi:hypothetical protein
MRLGLDTIRVARGDSPRHPGGVATTPVNLIHPSQPPKIPITMEWVRIMEISPSYLRASACGNDEHQASRKFNDRGLGPHPLREF